MRNELGAIAFRGQPETALAVQRDAFDIKLLSGDAVTLDAQHAGDDSRLFRRINGKDRRLIAIDRIGHGIENAGLFGIADQTRERTPTDRRTIDCRGDELRIGCFAFSTLIKHDMRADAAVFDQIDLIGRG